MRRSDLRALYVCLAWLGVFALGCAFGWLCHAVAYPFGEVSHGL